MKASIAAISSASSASGAVGGLPLFATPRSEAAPTPNERRRNRRQGPLRDPDRRPEENYLLRLGPRRQGQRPAAHLRLQQLAASPSRTFAATSTPRSSRTIIHDIFKGIINPEWYDRFLKQLKDDTGGKEWGERAEHRHLRQAGRRQVRVRDDRPAHDAARRRPQPNRTSPSAARSSTATPPAASTKKSTIPATSSGTQAVAGQQGLPDARRQTAGKAPGRQTARRSRPSGSGATKGKFPGIAGAEMADDQKKELQKVLMLLLEPYPQGRPGRGDGVPARSRAASTSAAWPSTRTATSATTANGTTGAWKARRSSGTSAAIRTSTSGSTSPMTPSVPLNAKG